jgi:colanic acid biosynthesis glycosyl transferase WcaI
LYQYMLPDDVVSAVLFTELCTGLAGKGWRVVASSSNRARQDHRRTYPEYSVSNGVEFRRVWRPALSQASQLGRIVNAIWMIVAWSLLALDRSLQPDVLIVGTDPVLSPIVAIVWRVFKPRVRLVHWCFDLYPEAAIAAGLLRENSFLVRLFKGLMRRTYRGFHLIVDIGCCMGERLREYDSSSRTLTVPPWALSEPNEPAPIPELERRKLFGEANLALLYSGNLGRAHSWSWVPELAHALQTIEGRIVFSARGGSVAKLRNLVDESKAPVDFVELAPAEGLAARVSAPDIHIVSLREDWTGASVPSKFFGALAVGRPVLFVGSRDSAIAKWIEQLGVGWVFNPERIGQLLLELKHWSQSPGAKARMFQHCHNVYQREFSRECALDRWNDALQDKARACDTRSAAQYA